ncbi:hypothetical protein QUF64_12855 [Anaerolineales bacterium HSG6]|nr:hypothetical protein [Anaerolineales bacterium HSG6]
MLRLTMDINATAEMLGTEPELFLELVKREQLKGVIKLNGSWRVSIFTLAFLLNTTPNILIELLEDYALGQLIEETANDDLFEGEEGLALYHRYVAEAQQ